MDINLNIHSFLHGGDYNPEQWLAYPEVLDKDLEYLVEANCNIVTLGVFSWASLEAFEGQYDFEWLVTIVDKLHDKGIYVMMATPSGARPKWLADKYQEVLRVDEKRQRQLFGARHNHCYTSSVYRKKVEEINQELAKRFANHPAIVGWHISNEFGGECHCPLCQDAFRDWVKKRYDSIEEVNEKWYTTFWSHNYQSFDQIESPSSIGENGLHGLNLDWKRFVTDQTIDFMKAEIQVLKSYNSDIPVTTNFMYYFNELNYFKFKEHLDFISWDTYPTWHKNSDVEIAMDNSLWHDMMRSIKQKPFILMESSPSYTNWQGISKPKKPGMHMLSSMQAIAHGSDAVMYFQWRQSRGASEKFHGSVVQHDGSNKTRVFQEVKQLGDDLNGIKDIQGSLVKSDIGIFYDWENKWALEDAQGPRNKGMHYKETVQKSYKGFRRLGLNVDFVDMESDYSNYKILVAPMLYMYRNNIQQKISQFIAQGGIVIMTYWSGIVDENDLCFLGKVPYKLNDVFGIERKEVIGFYDDEVNSISTGYTYKNLCEVIEPIGAKTLATYESDYYSGSPAVTVNEYGDGKAYYIGADLEQSFYDDLYLNIIKALNIELPIDGSDNFPKGILTSTRTDGRDNYLFIQNFSQETHAVKVDESSHTLIYGEGFQNIKPYGTNIYKY